jgi:hypothetical protein
MQLAAHVSSRHEPVQRYDIAIQLPARRAQGRRDGRAHSRTVVFRLAPAVRWLRRWRSCGGVLVRGRAIVV